MRNVLDVHLWFVMIAAWTLVLTSAGMGAYCALTFKKLSGELK